ncbi:MAG: type II toxin-antitoxin system RelE/ParE family toxin [Pseudomonadota bacterium]
MPRVVFRKSVRADLKSIGDYIARDNPSRAISFVRELKEACQTLEHFPKRHPIEPSLEENTHKMPYKNYLVFYRIDDEKDTVYIQAVIEGHKQY